MLTAMSDAAPYDPADYPPLAVTVDLVLMTVRDGRLTALLQRREYAPFAGYWALPGTFVGQEESLDTAAQRVLAEKAGMGARFLEQLYSFGDPLRDPRMRVVTVAYFALLPAAQLEAALTPRTDLVLAAVDIDGGAFGPDAERLRTAFDHARILGHAVERLRGKLDYSKLAFALLPELFTLGDLQRVHEAILDRPLNKPAFRRRILDRGLIEGSGLRETGKTYRPAELYRLRKLAN